MSTEDLPSTSFPSPLRPLDREAQFPLVSVPAQLTPLPPGPYINHIVTDHKGSCFVSQVRSLILCVRHFPKRWERDPERDITRVGSAQGDGCFRNISQKRGVESGEDWLA